MQELTFAEAIQKGLREKMLNDDRVFIIGEDIGILGGRYNVTRGLLKEFGPKRVIDIHLIEELFLGIALGAAQGGLIPVVEFLTSNFLLLGLSDVNRLGAWKFINVGKVRLPIIIRAPYGMYHSYGPELSGDYLSVFYNIPGIQIVIPRTPEDAYNFICASIDSKDPVLFMEHESFYSMKAEVSKKPVTLCGNSEIIQNGSDCSIISYGYTTNLARESVKLLHENVSVEIVNLITLKPLDIKTILKSVRKTGRALLIEEGRLGASVTSALAHLIRDLNPKIRIPQLGARDIPLPFGPLAKLIVPSQ